jgi:hypothetical protein
MTSGASLKKLGGHEQNYGAGAMAAYFLVAKAGFAK